MITPERRAAIQPFCVHHIKTQENPRGTDCAAHLCEGRIFACPFDSVEDARADRLTTGRWHCADFEAFRAALAPDAEGS